MSTRVDVEEIQTTPSERLLAIVLAVFLLIGGIWTYNQIEEWVSGSEQPVAVEPTPSEQAALQRFETANEQLGVAGRERDAALQNLELRREAYRTALDAGRQAPALERAYVAAQAGCGAQTPSSRAPCRPWPRRVRLRIARTSRSRRASRTARTTTA